MQPYADACAANRATWQERLTHLSAQPTTSLIQHDYPDAVRDPRLSTIFPLLLPPSLIASSDTTFEANGNATSTPPRSRSGVSGRGDQYPLSSRGIDSPATKAMRAVYHSSMEGRNKLSSWCKGSRAGLGDWQDGRRSSTPDGMIMTGRVIGV
jgi:hypothetical protein